MTCRTAREKRELLRVVRAPDGEIAYDPTGRAAGRGAYVCLDAVCVTAALKKGRLQSALEARIDPAIAEELLAAVAEAAPVAEDETDRDKARGGE